MAQEAHASPGPRRAPTGRRTCPARHFQGLARGWTAGTGPCRLPSGTDMAGGDGLGSRRHRPPGGPSGRPYLPPVLRPGPPRLPPVPGERGPLGNLRPLPGPLQPQASTGPAPQRSAADLAQAGRVLGSCATQGRRPWTPAAGAGAPRSHGPPSGRGLACPGLAVPAAALQRPTCSPGRPSWATPLPAHPQARGLPAQQPPGHPARQASAGSSRRPGQPLPGSRAAL